MPVRKTATVRLVAAQRAGRQLTLLHEKYAPGAETGDGTEDGADAGVRGPRTAGGNARPPLN